MRWVINVPVWGEEYRRRWIERGYPAIMKALEYAGMPEHRWVIHSDASEKSTLPWPLYMTESVTWKVRPFEVNTSCSLGTADRNGFAETQIGEAIMFFNADMVPSIEVFKRCGEIFETSGKRFVSCPSIRTMDAPPPVGVTGKDLADWATIYPHKFTLDCVWGLGKCKLPPYVIFHKNGNIVMHAFDLHPLAIFKDHDYALTAPTASEFIQQFSMRQIYVVTTPEMMIAEPTAHCEYARFKNGPFNSTDVASWARHAFAVRTQQQQFRRQIILRGLYDPQAQEVANAIYRETQVVSPIKFDTMPGRIKLGLMVPRWVRLMFPKWFREWFINFEWRSSR